MRTVRDRLLLALLPSLFSLTLFMSAGLFFLVELMIAKMILPLLGGERRNGLVFPSPCSICSPSGNQTKLSGPWRGEY
ncbi:MAG: hypothetical protein ACYDAA_13895 [Syntrophales bacterium]